MILELLKALLIGVVEGITEWLPISSTGHMILVDEFMALDVSEEFLALFLVVIQIGAILAVIVMYFHVLNPFSARKTPDERQRTWRLWAMVLIGCIPAAIFGFALDDWVNEHFYNKLVVASMLIVYGIVFIVLEKHNRMRETRIPTHAQPRGKHVRGNAHDSVQGSDSIFKISSVDDIDWKAALKIGCFQVLAIVPGTSRSGATIIGGMLAGCSRTAAAEFTFFLAIPVMFGWGLVKVVKYIFSGLIMSTTEISVLAVGVISAFIVSLIAIRFLMGYIKQNDFTAFGYYRIVVGVCVLVYFALETYGIVP